MKKTVLLFLVLVSCALPVQKTDDTAQLVKIAETAGKLEEAAKTAPASVRGLIGEAHEAVSECARTLYERDRALSRCETDLKEYSEKYSFWERTKSRFSVFLSGAAAGAVLVILLGLAVRFLWASIKTAVKASL